MNDIKIDFNFGNWSEDIHNADEQISRFERSKSSDLKPISVDYENEICFIKGSGKQPYKVTLDSCTCSDFIRRKLPCKHIYRLANELGYGTDDFLCGINRNELNGLMFKMPVKAQELLYDICKESCSYKEHTKFLIKKDNDYLPLVINGFCIESVDDFASAAKQMICSDLRKLIAESGLYDLPSPKAQKKTLVNWIREVQQEMPSLIEQEFAALELTPEAIALRHTIVKRFEERFDKAYFMNEFGYYYEDWIKNFVQDK